MLAILFATLNDGDEFGIVELLLLDGRLLPGLLQLFRREVVAHIFQQVLDVRFVEVPFVFRVELELTNLKLSLTNLKFNPLVKGLIRCGIANVK